MHVNYVYIIMRLVMMSVQIWKADANCTRLMGSSGRSGANWKMSKVKCWTTATTMTFNEHEIHWLHRDGDSTFIGYTLNKELISQGKSNRNTSNQIRRRSSRKLTKKKWIANQKRHTHKHTTASRRHLPLSMTASNYWMPKWCSPAPNRFLFSDRHYCRRWCRPSCSP